MPDRPGTEEPGDDGSGFVLPNGDGRVRDGRYRQKELGRQIEIEIGKVGDEVGSTRCDRGLCTGPDRGEQPQAEEKQWQETGQLCRS